MNSHFASVECRPTCALEIKSYEENWSLWPRQTPNNPCTLEIADKYMTVSSSQLHMRRDEIRGNQPVELMMKFTTLQPAEVNNHRRGIENVSFAKIKLFVLC